jgi:hypothetical protein
VPLSCQVDRILCYTMDGPIQNDPKVMLDFFLDRRLPGETWSSDPYEDNLRAQSVGMRKDYNAALDTLNREPAKSAFPAPYGYVEFIEAVLPAIHA